MQRWHLVTLLVSAATVAATLAPTVPGAPGGPSGAGAPPPSALPSDAPVAAADAPFVLRATLDQSAVLWGAPAERTVVLTLQAPDVVGEPRRPVHLALVVDTSGSMAARGKMEAARQAAGELVELLGPQDTLSLVTFDDRARVLAAPTPGTDAAALRATVHGLRPGGGTNLHDGIEAGVRLVSAAGLDGTRRVLVLSDGNATVGRTTAPDLRRAAASGLGDGVSVSALGLGLDYNEELLGALADAGGGAYRFVDRPGQLTTFFAEELRAAGRVVAHRTSVDLVPHPGVELVEIYGYESTPTADGRRVFLGDLHGGETRKVVARVRIAGSTAEGLLPVAQASVDWVGTDGALGRTLRAEVRAIVTSEVAAVARSATPAAVREAARARGAALVEGAARAWEKGDLAANQAMLAEATHLLGTTAATLGDAGLAAEADEISGRQAVFAAAPADSEAGRAEVKKAKEASREDARR